MLQLIGISNSRSDRPLLTRQLNISISASLLPEIYKIGAVSLVRRFGAIISAKLGMRYVILSPANHSAWLPEQFQQFRRNNATIFMATRKSLSKTGSAVAHQCTSASAPHAVSPNSARPSQIFASRCPSHWGCICQSRISTDKRYWESCPHNWLSEPVASIPGINAA